MHMGDPDEKNWIRNRIEGPEKEVVFTENGKTIRIETAISRRKDKS